LILNLITGDFYIGSSVKVNSRLEEHRYYLRRGDHQNPHLQRAWNRYGEEAFDLHLLVECEVRHVRSVEQVCIDTLQPTYNIAKSVTAPMLGRTFSHTEETRKKIGNGNRGKVRTQEVRDEQSRSRSGRKLSAETRAKMSTTRTGMKRGSMSEDQKAKLRAMYLGTRRSPEVCKKISEGMIGITKSAEVCQKISEGKIHAFLQKPYQGKR